MDENYSDLKKLILESKNSLWELGEHLQKAEGWLEEHASMQMQERAEINDCVSTLSKALAKLQQKINFVPADDSIREIHHQIGDSCQQVMQTISQIETECRKQYELEQLLENFHLTKDASGPENPKEPAQSPREIILEAAQKEFRKERYEECAELLHALLRIIPEEPEALRVLQETERHWEDQRMTEELTIHLENVKREAIVLFDQGNYEECLGKFEFLCEVDPDNPSYQEYMNLSREELNRLPKPPVPLKITPDNERVTASEVPGSSPLPYIFMESEIEKNLCPANAILPFKEPFSPSSETAQILSTDSTAEEPLTLPAFSSILNSNADTPATTKDPLSNTGCTKANANETGIAPSIEMTPIPVMGSMPDLPESSSSLKEPDQNPGMEPPPAKENQELTEKQPLSEGGKRKEQFLFAIAAILLIMLFPAWLTWHWLKNQKNIGGPDSTTKLVINTLPPGAEVQLDGKIVGNSDLTLSRIAAGYHSLRLEMSGYQVQTQEFTVQAGQANQISIQLAAIPTPAQIQEDPLATAETLLQQRKYSEAFQKSSLLLKDDPENKNARQIQEQVRVHFLQAGNQAIKANKWEEARKISETTINLFPKEPTALNQLKIAKGKIQELQTAFAAETTRKAKILEVEQKLKQALNSGIYFPPQSENAVELSRQLTMLDAANASASGALNIIRQHLATQAQQRISQQDLEGARTVIAQLQTYFAGSTEIANLNALCRNEEIKQKSQLTDWTRKIDTALAEGHFVTPSQDNVILYCNRFLTQGGAKAKAIALKQEAFSKAIGQAREWIKNEKFEEARDVFAALQAFSPYENGIPLPAEEIKTELNRLEFQSWPVTHDHALGSCTGQIQFNSYVISYIPRGESKDGFHSKFSEVKQSRMGDRLKIEFRNKTYRFQVSQTALQKLSPATSTSSNQVVSSLSPGDVH